MITYRRPRPAVPHYMECRMEDWLREIAPYVDRAWRKAGEVALAAGTTRNRAARLLMFAATRRLVEMRMVEGIHEYRRAA